MRTTEEGSDMAVAATETRPADVGLKREMGLIGATWASETSIIGSGWLFRALFAAQAAGTAALLGWVIGGLSRLLPGPVRPRPGGGDPGSQRPAGVPPLACCTRARISLRLRAC